MELPLPDGDAPPSSETAAAATPYQGLARRYRPRHFGELIGQEAMVRTLKNAFLHNRIAQAWMLTGVRGVGKTTTARILARALNYQRHGIKAPTIDIAEPGDHCQAIMEGRHVDVIEMDAASNTGIGDVREIIEASRYKPVLARMKVFIIDEVHMLSTQAFNGLLKTLEEPPAHVKFIFATTEIRKVPITVLSRCQRFDLRRIDAAVLTEHLAGIAEREGIAAEDEALRLVTRAAEGSVRDALSLLDQAIAHGGGTVTADTVRDMLGLADRARILDLFEMVMRGDAAAALAELAAQYDVGADPVVVLSDLATLTHEVTRQKVTGAPGDMGEPQEVRERSAAFAQTLSVAVLSRTFQALLSGLEEVQTAPHPVTAAEMVLVRLAYMAMLPEPEPLPLTDGPAARRQEAAAQSVDRKASAPAPASAVRVPETFAQMAALVGRHSVKLKNAVERSLREKRFERGRIEVSVEPGADPSVAGALGAKLTELTGERWVVSVSEGASAPTLAKVRADEQAALQASAREEPLVRAVLERFADAEIVEVRQNEIAGSPDEADAKPARAGQRRDA